MHLTDNNKNCILYPRPLTYHKEFLLFYNVSLTGLTRCYKAIVFVDLLTNIAIP